LDVVAINAARDAFHRLAHRLGQRAVKRQAYFALSIFAKIRYAPGTPAGSWRNQEYALKM